jgi:hypothetical protein
MPFLKVGRARSLDLQNAGKGRNNMQKANATSFRQWRSRLRGHATNIICSFGGPQRDASVTRAKADAVAWERNGLGTRIHH